jgi:hypothetical protein
MLPLYAIAALGQAAIGGLQAATSGRSEREKELEKYAKQSPLYKGSKSVDDYYQEAMNRYKTNPYQSLQYQVGQKNIQRAMAAGLSNLQDRRSAIGASSRLFGAQADALSNLGVQAEAQRNQAFGQLGGATQMKTGEEYKKFDINQMTPYNRMLQLKQFKAEAANQRFNAGMQMIGGAASNAAMGSVYAGADKLAKVTPEVTSDVNLNSYNTLKKSPYEFAANYIDYNAQSANPSAFGSNYMDFNKYNNTLAAPKYYRAYKSF